MLVCVNMVSSANRFVRVPGDDGMSLMYRLKSSGEGQDPWETPATISRGDEKESSWRTLKDLFSKNELTMFTSWIGRYRSVIFASRLWYLPCRTPSLVEEDYDRTFFFIK